MLLLIPSGNPIKCHEVLSLQPLIPPKRFDISLLTGGCPEGLDAFEFFFKNIYVPWALWPLFPGSGHAPSRCDLKLVVSISSASLFLYLCRFADAFSSCYYYYRGHKPAYPSPYSCLKKNLNAPRPSEHPPVRGKKCCCFSHSAYWLPTRKNYFTRWPIPLVVC